MEDYLEEYFGHGLRGLTRQNNIQLFHRRALRILFSSSISGDIGIEKQSPAGNKVTRHLKTEGPGFHS